MTPSRYCSAKGGSAARPKPGCASFSGLLGSFQPTCRKPCAPDAENSQGSQTSVAGAASGRTARGELSARDAARRQPRALQAYRYNSGLVTSERPCDLIATLDALLILARSLRDAVRLSR